MMESQPRFKQMLIHVQKDHLVMILIYYSDKQTMRADMRTIHDWISVLVGDLGFAHGILPKLFY